MKQVKGAAFVNFVKTIRADKSGIYNKYLNEQDLSIINSTIQPINWYPYDTFKRCFSAVFEVAGKNNPNNLTEWGRLYCEKVLNDFFKITIKEGNPLEYIKRIPFYIQNFFDFGTTSVTVENPKSVILEMRDYDPDFKALYIFSHGWFYRAAELCGAQYVQCQFVEKSWLKKSNTTSYRITWE